MTILMSQESLAQMALYLFLISFVGTFGGYTCYQLVRMIGEEIREHYRRKRWSAKYRLAVLQSRQQQARKAMIWHHRFLKRVARLIEREKTAVASERP